MRTYASAHSLALLVVVASACGPSAESTATATGPYAIGGFSLSIDGGGLTVTSTDGTTAFAAPPDGAWLHMGEADLTAKEHQGSFAIEEDVQRLCVHPLIDAVEGGSGVLSLRGRFADCEDSAFEARFDNPLVGHLAFEVIPDDARWTLLTLRGGAEAGERFYGLGEQAPHHSLNLKGRRIPILAQEGGVGRGHLPITPAVNAVSEGSGGSEESTYYAAPHVLSSHNRSFFLENTEYAVFDFTEDAVVSAAVHSTSLRGRILSGSSPLELIERFTEYAGRMPAPPEWLDAGAIVALARPLAQGLDLVDELIAEGAAISGVWNQTWSGVSTTYIGEQVLWNWVQNDTHHPGWARWVEDLRARGARTLCYVNPMFRPLPEDAGHPARNLYEEGREGHYFVHDEHGDVLMLPVTAFDVALLDLWNEDARRWMKDILIDEMIGNAGCRGWMADFAEALPFEAVLADGRTGAEAHNEYPVEWARLNREAVEEAGMLGEVLVFNRSGHTTTPRHSMLLWQGDQLTTWDRYDGLHSAVHGLISGGFSGIALNHSDIGGYTSLSWSGLGYVREPELLRRWTELAAFTSAMRTHEGNQPGANAQIYSDRQSMAHFARMTKVYRALSSYRRELFAEAETAGWPVVRHMAMQFPDIDEFWGMDDQFMFGADVVVAPVLEKCWGPAPCAPRAEVFLPPGQWRHMWSGEVYGHEEAADRVTVSAPLGEPAVFVSEGRWPELRAALVAAGLDVGAGGAAPTLREIQCGASVTGDTESGEPLWDAYACNVGHYEAPEVVFSWTAPRDGAATFSLVDPRPTEVDHDVMVVDPAGECLAWGHNSTSVEVHAGEQFLLVVDGYDGDSGPFTARLDCE